MRCSQLSGNVLNQGYNDNSPRCITLCCPPGLSAYAYAYPRIVSADETLIGMTLFGMRNGLWLLLFFCHGSESFLLLATPTARQGGGSPLVRPLEGSEFFDACSSAPVAIVLFHGEQCRSCKAFTPKFARLAQQYQGQAEFFRVVASRNTALCAAENVMTLLPW